MPACKRSEGIYGEIIEKIKSNRISTTEIADCLGKTGDMPGLMPVNKGQFKVGRVFFSYAYNESNWELHEQVQTVNEDDIVIVEAHNCADRAIFGSLVSKYILLYRRASAIVVNGYMRDAHQIIKEDYPIWCKGLTPIGCYNKKNNSPIDGKVLDSWKKKYEGAIAVCDDGGVVLIQKDNINQGFLEKLDFIELQEDIWSYCINTKKWSTFDTVCLKEYLNTELLPKELKDKFETFTSKVNEKNK